MKKQKFAPLSLDKETVNLLDKKQLSQIKGGTGSVVIGGSTGCGSGGSTCDLGNSTGCGSGGSTCLGLG